MPQHTAAATLPHLPACPCRACHATRPARPAALLRYAGALHRYALRHGRPARRPALAVQVGYLAGYVRGTQGRGHPCPHCAAVAVWRMRKLACVPGPMPRRLTLWRVVPYAVGYVRGHLQGPLGTTQQGGCLAWQACPEHL